MVGPTTADLLRVAQAAVEKARAAERDLLTRIAALRAKRSGFVKSDIAALDAELAVVRHELVCAQKDADVQLAEMRAQAAERERDEALARANRSWRIGIAIAVASTLAAWWNATH